MSGHGSRCGGKILWRSLSDLERKPAADSAGPVLCTPGQDGLRHTLVLVLRRPAGVRATAAVRAVCETPVAGREVYDRTVQKPSDGITQCVAGDR